MSSSFSYKVLRGGSTFLHNYLKKFDAIEITTDDRIPDLVVLEDHTNPSKAIIRASQFHLSESIGNVEEDYQISCKLSSAILAQIPMLLIGRPMLVYCHMFLNTSSIFEATTQGKNPEKFSQSYSNYRELCLVPSNYCEFSPELVQSENVDSGYWANNRSISWITDDNRRVIGINFPVVEGQYKNDLLSELIRYHLIGEYL